MGNLKRRLRRIEKAARGHLTCIELKDGSRHYFDPEQTAIELFLYTMDCLRAQGTGRKRKDPPEIIRAIVKAKDREAAFLQLRPGGRVGLFPLEVDALVQRGEIVHRSLVAGRELDEPLDEPETHAGAEVEESDPD
jgi:hypothetical protein